MADNERLLSDDELRAIEEMVASGDLGGEGYNVGVATGAIDLTLQDTSVGVNISALDQVNDRFHRFMRSGLFEDLRYNARLQAGRVEIIRYSEYVQSMTPPLAVNVTKIEPLRGECLCIVHSQVVFSCLDNWFGGAPRPVASVPAGRVFTPTEDAVIERIVGVIYQSLKESWAPFLTIECERTNSEISAVFANIAADEDMVILNRFETSGGGENLGFIDIVYPYASLKLIRELLRSRIQTTSGNEQSDNDWAKNLLASLDEVPMEVVVTAAEVAVSVERLMELKVGDWISFRPPENAEVAVNGFPIFKAEVGSLGSQVAIQIAESVMPEE